MHKISEIEDILKKKNNELQQFVIFLIYLVLIIVAIRYLNGRTYKVRKPKYLPMGIVVFKVSNFLNAFILGPIVR